MSYEQAVKEAERQMQESIKAHEAKIKQMQVEYEDMMVAATQKMESLITQPAEEPVKGGSVTKIQTDDGETHYVFNQQAMDANSAIMDAMIEILNELK